MSAADENAFFHIQLLSSLIDMEKYPFIRLIIESRLSKSEYESLIGLLSRLNDTWEQQKREGLMNFTSLLVEFAGMLTEKLNPDEVIDALWKEGEFTGLMEEFKSLIEQEEHQRNRSKKELSRRG